MLGLLRVPDVEATVALTGEVGPDQQDLLEPTPDQRGKGDAISTVGPRGRLPVRSVEISPVMGGWILRRERAASPRCRPRDTEKSSPSERRCARCRPGRCGRVVLHEVRVGGEVGVEVVAQQVAAIDPHHERVLLDQCQIGLQDRGPGAEHHALFPGKRPRKACDALQIALREASFMSSMGRNVVWG